MYFINLLFFVDISLIVVDEHMWCISKPKDTLLSITFNVWNFIGEVRWSLLYWYRSSLYII